MKVVIFHPNNTRIIHTDDASPYYGRADVLIDPKEPLGIPPHCWKLEDGKIAVHDAAEIDRRREVLHGTPRVAIMPPSKRAKQLPSWLIPSLISSSITAIILQLLHH